MEAAPHHLNFSARKKLVSGVRRPKVHPHFVGFVIQTLTGRGHLLQSKLSTDDLSTTVLVIVMIISTFPIPAPGVPEPGTRGPFPADRGEVAPFEGWGSHGAGGHRLQLCIGQTERPCTEGAV